MRSCVLACALVLAATTPVTAQPDFAWHAPAACPDTAAITDRIEKRLGGRLEIHGVAVAITRAGNRFVAHIDARGITLANHVRTLSSARCDELADAVAVVVARLAREQRAHAATAPLVGFAAIAPPPEVTLAAPFIAVTGRLPRIWHGGLRALALSGIGTVPQVSFGGELAVFVRRHAAFLEVGYARWAARSSYLAEGAPGRVDVALATSAVRVGWAPDRMPLRAWLGTEIGAMTGQGGALVDPQSGSGPWVALTAGFGVGWPMSRYAKLVGTFEIAVPLTTVHFALEDGRDLYRSDPASARCAFGLELGLR